MSQPDPSFLLPAGVAQSPPASTNKTHVQKSSLLVHNVVRFGILIPLRIMGAIGKSYPTRMFLNPGSATGAHSTHDSITILPAGLPQHSLVFIVNAAWIVTVFVTDFTLTSLHSLVYFLSVRILASNVTALEVLRFLLAFGNNSTQVCEAFKGSAARERLRSPIQDDRNLHYTTAVRN